MLLAMVNDVRVVLLRLASREQTLRYFAARKGDGVDVDTQGAIAPRDARPVCAARQPARRVAAEVGAGGLAFRLLEPDTYKQLARLLDEKRVERERFIADAIGRLPLSADCRGITGEVSGRPKHIVSIHTRCGPSGWRSTRSTTCVPCA